MGPCAKARVKCTLVTPTGEHIVGENRCAQPHTICPRAPGEGYEKCKTVCHQVGHAEVDAVMVAGERARGARAYIEGHTYACMDCQHRLWSAGVISVSVGAPPPPRSSDDDKIVREWMAQVKCLMDAGLPNSQARAIIAVLSQNGWLLIHHTEYPEGSTNGT